MAAPAKLNLDQPSHDTNTSSNFVIETINVKHDLPKPFRPNPKVLYVLEDSSTSHQIAPTPDVGKPDKSNQQRNLGILLSILSVTFILGSRAVFKYLVMQKTDTFLINFAGFVESAIVSLVAYFMYSNEMNMRIFKKQVFHLIVLGVLSSTGIIGGRLGLAELSIGTATVIYFLRPVITFIIVAATATPNCKLIEAMFAVLALSGVVLVIAPSAVIYGELKPWWAYVLAFLQAVLMSLYSIYLRTTTCCSLHFSIPVLSQSVIGLITSSLLLPFVKDWTLPSAITTLVIFLFYGMFLTLGFLFSNCALAIGKTGAVAMIRTSEITVAIVLQIVAFRDVPSVTSLFGVILAQIGVTGVAYMEYSWKLIPVNRIDAVKTPSKDDVADDDVCNFEMAALQ